MSQLFRLIRPEIRKLLSVYCSWHARAAYIRKSVGVYDYTASTDIVISVFVPELWVFEMPELFFVDHVLSDVNIVACSTVAERRSREGTYVAW
jgi:hypothetical protein